MRTISGIVLLAAVLGLGISAAAQTESATLTGRITDQSGAVVTGAEVIATNVDTEVSVTTLTNDVGVYAIPGLHPGTYRLTIRKIGFQQIVRKDIVLHVQEVLTQNFDLPLGSVSETVTVTGGTPLVNTESAAVSTVVDRQFVENLPLNGRSFQTLIQLTPGVALTTSNSYDSGQFSVNGQRAASNYWTVDGVSANVGIASSVFKVGNGLSGSMPSLSTLGGTNSLVSVDALQEFRIQTSTYAPEFGRTPGGQISIVTRSGTNQFHGTVFNYVRNDVFDANDWFANANRLPKPRERQNDFGGTFSGPILRDKLFSFFSYEGLRLRLPRVAQSLVPDLTARQSAVLAMQPYVNAYPLPNGADNLATGVAGFNASYSDSAGLDAYSLRIDDKLTEKWTVFGRYNYSPSSLTQRGLSLGNLSSVFPAHTTIQSATLGATWTVSSTKVNDLRFNYSKTNSHSDAQLDHLGGAVPLSVFPFPSPFTTKDSQFVLAVFSLGTRGPTAGPQGNNQQKQTNIIDNFSWHAGTHALKFGADYRRLTPFYGTAAYEQQVLFLNVNSLASGSAFLANIFSSRNGTFLLNNLGVFGQDTWRVARRLTLTYGARWDVDFAPSSNPALPSLIGFDLSNLSNVDLAPQGTPPFGTRYGSIAPRLGFAYQMSSKQNSQTVLRGGVGLFYDLTTSELGNAISINAFPFGVVVQNFSVGFPLSTTLAAAPAITPAALSSQRLYAFDPRLKAPYTVQWSAALERALGSQQIISASYVGSVGRRLIQSASVGPINQKIGFGYFVTNRATSDYHALQVQFLRRLHRGLQTLASYTWSHSIDTASAGSVFGNEANAFVRGMAANRGPSDFDVRHALSAGITYDIPAPKNGFKRLALSGWSLENIIQARSALPIELYDGSVTQFGNRDAGFARPDVVAGQPLYLYGSQYPGGKAFNPAAFIPPPKDSAGRALRQGNLSRNALRGFGAAQWDFAVHRAFPIHESLKLKFQAEMFNVLNHPNFAPPVPDISNKTQFGLSTKTLANYLGGGNLGSGSFSPLYQMGGPRSIQFALKLQF